MSRPKICLVNGNHTPGSEWEAECPIRKRLQGPPTNPIDITATVQPRRGRGALRDAEEGGMTIAQLELAS